MLTGAKNSGPKITKQGDYTRQRTASLKRVLEQSRAGRDIGAMPKCKHPKRRAAAVKSLEKFCNTYFSETYALPFSDDHRKVLAKAETAIIKGGLFSMAMPRGSGKTTICETAAIWALFTARRRFVFLIGSDEDSATRLLTSIKTELEANATLSEDFPEICGPIHKLERISHRCRGQTIDGSPTYIVWNAKELALPTVAGSKASGGVVKVAGITGHIRGTKAKTSKGASIRPDLVIIDDPQTDESARSPAQCATRAEILNGAVLGLAGPGSKMSGLMPCTVIRKNDLADQLLDRTRSPHWHGERTKLVYKWPTAAGLWEKYAQIRIDDLQAGGTGSKATEYYADHRAAMDAGSKVAWKQRHNPDQISALQFAYDLLLTDEHSFASEYQNAPIDRGAETVKLTPQEIATNTTGYKRGEIPTDAEYITAFIDVHAKLLYYVLAAWRPDFTGYVIDYGTWPDQSRRYFSQAEARTTIKTKGPKGASRGGQIYNALETLTGRLYKTYRREDGAPFDLAWCLIDANWGESTDLVYQFIAENRRPGLTPSHGKYFGATTAPMSAWNKKAGIKAGHHWRYVMSREKRQVRHVLHDSNYWKSYIHDALGTAAGQPGRLSLFKDTPPNHACFADHLCAENKVEVESKGRRVDEWKSKPHRPDNHWLDCIVGAAVGASMAGAAGLGHNLRRKKAAPDGTQKKRSRRVSKL